MTYIITQVLEQRLAVAIARGILADASVLMLHKPTATLSAAHADKVLHYISIYSYTLSLHEYIFIHALRRTRRQGPAD